MSTVSADQKRLDLAVADSVRRKLAQYAKHISVVDGTEKGDLRKWLQAVDHAKHSVEPGDPMLIEMIGPLITGGLATFVRTKLQSWDEDHRTWEKLRAAIVTQFLGKGEARYWKDKVERLKQESYETVREYASRFMFHVNQAYTQDQLKESVVAERLVNKFIKGIRNSIIRGTVTMLVADELEKVHSDTEEIEEEEEEEEEEDEVKDDEGTARKNKVVIKVIRRVRTTRGPDLQKLVDCAASVAFGYEKEEEEEPELEAAALPPPPPALLEESPIQKEQAGIVKSFQKDLRTFITSQKEYNKQLREEIAALKTAPPTQPAAVGAVPAFPVNQVAGQVGAPVPTQIHNHYSSWTSGRGRGRGRGRGTGRVGYGTSTCWYCGQVGHFQRECPVRAFQQQQQQQQQQHAFAGMLPTGSGYHLSSQGNGSNVFSMQPPQQGN